MQIDNDPQNNTNEFYPNNIQQPMHIEKKHSGLGIASFVISLLSGLSIASSIVLSVIFQAISPGSMQTENSVETLIVGLIAIGSLLLALVALILGIAGAAQRDRKLLFSVLGIVFSVVILLGTTCLIGLGTAMGG